MYWLLTLVIQGMTSTMDNSNKNLELNIKAIRKCHPAIVPKLPTRLQSICKSLLRAVEQYYHQYQQYTLDHPSVDTASSLARLAYKRGTKREEPEHVFLRFGRGL